MVDKDKDIRDRDGGDIPRGAGRLAVRAALPQLAAAGAVLLGRGPRRPRARAGHHGARQDGRGWRGHARVQALPRG